MEFWNHAFPAVCPLASAETLDPPKTFAAELLMLWIILQDGCPEVLDAGWHFVVPSGDWWGLWFQKEMWSKTQHRNKPRVFVFVLAGFMACGILVPWPWNKLRPFTVKAPNSNHGGGGGGLIAQFHQILCNPTGYSMWIEASLSFTVSQSLLKLMFIESVMPSNHLTLYCPLLLLPSIFPNIRVFSNVLALHIRRPKYWSFSSSPSNEYSGLISFRIDWFDLLAVQGTLKSLQ